MIRRKLAAIGVTGGTGAAFIEQALDRGHDVVAIARRPEAITISHPNLTVHRGDARIPETLAPAIRGCDAFVSIVGISGLLQARKGTTLYSDTAKAMVQAVDDAGVPRVMAVTSSGVEPQANDGWFYTNVLKRFFLEPIYIDMRVMERTLRQSDLDWTIVRPSFLVGKARKVDYRISPDRNFSDDKSLSRWSLAHFLVTEAEAAQFGRRQVSISN